MQKEWRAMGERWMGRSGLNRVDGNQYSASRSRGNLSPPNSFYKKCTCFVFPDLIVSLLCYKHCSSTAVDSLAYYYYTGSHLNQHAENWHGKM
jgi:hypothetical protein